ncbi:hypothetical protein [Crucian carp herpesvirus]|uniref:ORF154 n=1 Tax=Cyprinid herpesvirus 2 TaxID=317878 RepID=K7PBR2_CYHV2|nr:protein ORF154 [Cyprinid herpesvirus 2]APB92849.1 hypothetical protein [Crucian carp herpesvirus]AFJ20606.1 protein ORF154 [Cyprinid herpesvirus 2]AKC02098.1 hypothetical protein [Cyprinid herpesvirus 2]AMB21726.1 ORF154 [Cyprinid herpesvirus 2]QAU54878.1 protein ORF154 [Cyprinid herpesvirus 2]
MVVAADNTMNSIIVVILAVCISLTLILLCVFSAILYMCYLIKALQVALTLKIDQCISLTNLMRDELHVYRRRLQQPQLQQLQPDIIPLMRQGSYLNVRA